MAEPGPKKVGRPWGPLRGSCVEMNDLAVMIRSWLTGSERTAAELQEALTADDFTDGKIPTLSQVYRMLAGQGIRLDFVEAAALFCSSGEAGRLERMRSAKALFEQARIQPTPAMSGGPERALAISERRVAALEHATSLQEALRIAESNAHQAQLLVMMLHGLTVRQADRIRDLEHAQAESRTGTSSSETRLDLRARLDRARDQIATLRKTVRQAETELAEHKSIAEAAARRLQELEEEIRRLSRRGEEPAKALPVPMTDLAETLDQEHEAVAAMVIRAQDVLEQGRSTSRAAAAHAGLELPVTPHDVAVVRGEVVPDPEASPSIDPAAQSQKLFRTTRNNLPASTNSQDSGIPAVGGPGLSDDEARVVEPSAREGTTAPRHDGYPTDGRPALTRRSLLVVTATAGLAGAGWLTTRLESGAHPGSRQPASGATSQSGLGTASHSPEATTAPPAPILAGHTDTVTSVAFSPDGSTLASGSRDQTIRLWSVTDSTHHKGGARLVGHDDSVTSVAFSPDGRTLASGSYDQSIRLWNVTDSAHSISIGLPIKSHTDAVTTVAFSPEGRTLASGSYDETIRLWNVSDPAHPMQIGQLQASDPGTLGSVTSVAFSPDGRTLASSGDNLFLCNVADPANPAFYKVSPLWFLDDFRKTANTAIFRPKNHILICASATYFQVWNVANPAHPSAAMGPFDTAQQDALPSAAFSPDGNTLAIGALDKVLLWNMTDPTRPKPIGQPLTGHTATVTTVAFSRDGRTLASGSFDNTIRLWKIA